MRGAGAAAPAGVPLPRLHRSAVRPQAEKLPFGKTRSIVTFAEGLCVVQAALYPVILALVGDGDANVGMMLDTVPQLQELLAGLQSKAERYETAEAAE